MTNEPAVERAYLRRRAAQHRHLAATASDPARRSLHERFAALYDARWDAVAVQDD